jgi:hypothetical protein
MTMIFEVRPGVSLEPLKAGQSIRFELVQKEAGEYVIQRIYPGDGQGVEVTEPADEIDAEPAEVMDHEGHHHD